MAASHGHFPDLRQKLNNFENENDNIPPIMIGPTEIKRVSEIKFLCVVIDEKLSWDAHAKSLTWNRFIFFLIQ